MASPQDMETARQARMVALVLVATVVLWMGASFLGGKFGWETRYAFLFDLAALAAFFWTMVVTYRIWRKRQSN
ncbi:DUF5337 domain-containing protein [Paragemmobacter straminiformis]|uniref:DUF5337 domain-containing protein n=1 Tax=Paragemmobacter straminiformis TaxID=2045119 RepID=A0A842IB09_9RHOB|nr:DUF5337 domain-containing protein [Gemmobacter straminiformis]MBC2836776.1 DUF5337 domain-containing protein [Gemmobacter straminiformis]